MSPWVPKSDGARVRVRVRVREGSERAQRASESIGRYKPTGLRWGSKAACFVLI